MLFYIDLCFSERVRPGNGRGRMILLCPKRKIFSISSSLAIHFKPNFNRNMAKTR